MTCHGFSKHFRSSFHPTKPIWPPGGQGLVAEDCAYGAYTSRRAMMNNDYSGMAGNPA